MPRSALIRQRTMLRSAWPGSSNVNLPGWPATVFIVVLKCGSLVAFTLSKKYSMETLETPASLAENVTFTRTGWEARMMIEFVEFWTADFSITTGLGVTSETAFAAPGLGPLSGEASQLAGSLGDAVKLTRSSERPLYW